MEKVKENDMETTLRLGFRVLGFRIWGVGFRILGLGFGLGFGLGI